MNSPATVEEEDAAPSGVYRDAEGLPSPCHRDYEGTRTQFKDDDDNEMQEAAAEEQPCFLDALPDAAARTRPWFRPAHLRPWRHRLPRPRREAGPPRRA